MTSSPSDNGSVTLQWTNPDAVEVVLEQSETEAFDSVLVRYRGTGDSSVLSGLAEGRHFFRIGPVGSDTRSGVLAVEVKFFPRDRLLLLLVIGGVVVMTTIITIIVGAVQNREREAA